MEARIRTRRMRSYILISGLIIAVGFGTWIGCSKDTGVSSTTTPPVRAGKPAVAPPVDFQPQTGVNYDPFRGMTFEERKAAVGGVEGAVKHLEVIARHIALLMNDEKARNILQGAVPKSDEGEVHLAQLIIDNPYLLTVLSGGFKDNISTKAIGDQLSQVIKDTDSNGEAILKASKALLDLMVSVATSDGGGWDASNKIPVFYVPANDDDGATMQGVDADLKAVSFVINGDKIPYSFLYLNYDENSPMLHAGTQVTRLSFQPESPIESLWASWRKTFRSFSLIPSADAHSSPGYHGPHYFILQPVRLIVIYDDHEPVTKPDIYVRVTIRIHPDQEIYHTETFNLEDVDEENKNYTNYAYLRATHGIAYEWNYNYLQRITIYESDGFANEDDEIGEWGGYPNLIYLWRVNRGSRLYDFLATGDTQPADGEIVVWKTNETYDTDIGR